MIRLAALVVTSALTSVPLHAATYTLEPDYTQGVFRWNHLGFSNPGAQFSQGEGTLVFDPAHPTQASVRVTIPIASINTGVPALDEHLRSEDFFAIAQFPAATFKSTKVEAGGAPNRLKVTGELSLHGVTRPVILNVTVIKLGVNPRTQVPTAGFEATTTLMRSDFGLGKYVPQVSDAVEMRIVSQAAEAKAYAAYLQAEAAAAAAAKKK